MKKLTHEEIKALPKDTKVLVEMEFEKVSYSSEPLLRDSHGLERYFQKDNPIYLPSDELQPLPEEMPEWLNDDLMHFCQTSKRPAQIWQDIVRHYGTHPREWWMDLKPGDKFTYKDGRLFTFNGKHFIGHGITMSEITMPVTMCRPYTEPTLEEKFIASLSPEQKEAYKKLKQK